MTRPVLVFPLSLAIGAAIWLVTTVPGVRDLRGPAWSLALLTFAALVLVPLLLDVVGNAQEPERSPNWRAVRRLQFPAAVLLLGACHLDSGVEAVALALPWVVFTGLLALAGLWRIVRLGIAPFWRLCQDAGLILFAVGGAWTLADRAALHPLGFGSDIVQLTAVHFHYAGLTLPILTGCVLREFPRSSLAAAAGVAVLAGVPLVAMGITWAQLHGGTVGELVAALVLAPGAMVVAGYQLRLAVRSGQVGLAESLWVVSGVALLAGMALALCYAARGQFLPLPWLNIPWMRALHGSLNALGFGLCGTVAWWLAARRR